MQGRKPVEMLLHQMQCWLTQFNEEKKNNDKMANENLQLNGILEQIRMKGKMKFEMHIKEITLLKHVMITPTIKKKQIFHRSPIPFCEPSSYCVLFFNKN